MVSEFLGAPNNFKDDRKLIKSGLLRGANRSRIELHSPVEGNGEHCERNMFSRNCQVILLSEAVAYSNSAVRGSGLSTPELVKQPDLQIIKKN